MFGAKELDIRNKYNPNLSDIGESAERTYGEANSFFKKEELYLKEIERQISSGELTDEKQIYDESHAIASDLAKCCEMYLKALFLFEHKDGELTCDELWSILEARMREDKTKDDGRVRDDNGNVVYYRTDKDNETPLYHPDGRVIYVYAKVDSEGNLVKDVNGKQVYVDKYGVEYDEARKGRAVKTNGHSLDRLIGLILPKSRLLLETRMLTIPMEETEENKIVSILDKLQKNNLLEVTEHISQEQFLGWLDQHKRTFEESRFSGQKEYDISVEFMFHLATQIRAVVQYRMAPKKSQCFTVTDEELSKLPADIKQFISLYSNHLSDELIKLIISDENIKNKIISLLSGKNIIVDRISQKSFYNIIKFLDINEINFISLIFHFILIDELIDNRFSKYYTNSYKKALFYAKNFHSLKFSFDEIVDLILCEKMLLRTSIISDYFYSLFKILFCREFNIKKPSFTLINIDNVDRRVMKI